MSRVTPQQLQMMTDKHVVSSVILHTVESALACDIKAKLVDILKLNNVEAYLIEDIIDECFDKDLIATDGAK